MGLWDVVDSIGDAIEDGVEAVVEGAGQVIDDALDFAADGAKAIGLDGIGEGLDDLGDNIASATGGDVEEEELGETEDPKELIRGEPSEISSTAETLQKMAAAIESTGQALKQIDAADWVGEGADAFNAVYDKQPKLWFDCADAFTSAAMAMRGWHNEVKTAQDKAADAIDKWKAADAEERRQKNWWNSLTGEQQAQTPLVDTWTSMRNDAREILRGARTQRDNGASIAVSAFAAATEKAPKEPPFTERWMANVSDLYGVLEHGALNFTSGLLTSFTGLVQFVRQVNPTDTYNLTHPAEYAAGLSDLATGLVVAAADPGATVSAILSDARKNPFEFLGSLTGDALLTAATGGGGSAKTAINALRKLKDASRLARGAEDVGRHLPRVSPHPTPTHEPPGTPSHLSMETSQRPAPTNIDNGHTPTNTNPIQANSHHDAPAPRTEPSPHQSEPAASNPTQHAPEPTHHAPEPTHHAPEPSPTHHAPDPAPTRHADPDPTPASHTDPSPGPNSHTDPSPTPNQRVDPTPDHSPAPRADPDPAPSPHTRTDPDPASRPNPDPDPDPRTDPRPEVRNPAPHADTTPHVEPEHAPSPRSAVDSTPTPHANADAPATPHARPEGTTTPHTNPETTSPHANPETASPHTNPETTSPHTNPETTSPHTNPDTAASPHTSPDTTASPHTNTDTTPSARTDSDQTPSARPDARVDPDSSPAAHSQPDATAPGRPNTPDGQPGATRQPDPVPAWHGSPAPHVDSPAPHTRPDGTPGTRPQPDSTPANRPHSDAPRTDPATRTQPDRAPAARTNPDHAPTTRPQPDKAPTAQPHRDPVPASRADPHSSPSARTQPHSPAHARPEHTPQRPHADQPPRAHSDAPQRHPDSPTRRGPDGDANPRAPHHDPDRPPGRRDGSDRPHHPDDPPRDRHPDRDHQPDRDRQPDHDRQSDRDRKPDNERGPDHDRKPDHDRHPDRDRHPEHDRKPDHERAPDRDRKPDHDSERDRKPDHDREPDPDRDHKPDRDREPGRDRQPDHDREPDHERAPDRDRKPDHDSERDRKPDHDREPDPDRDHKPNRDHEPDRDREPERDRQPDHDREPNRDPDHDPDHPTGQDRADADRNAHDHVRESGPETDRTPEQKTCSEDPVDISTGEFLLPETDLDLPGVLSLTLLRAHHSNYRFGRWFGPSWSSTLDARIVIEDAGVTFIGENAMMLAYPHAEVGVPVHPLTEGQQWSLTRTEAGGYRVRDQRRELIWHFAPELGLDGIEARFGNYAVSAITDRHHNRLRFHYDADGVPIEVTHSGGYRVRIDSDRARITGLSLLTDDPDIGEFATPILEFTYDETDLIAVTDADGATTRYTYDADHRMTSWTDSNGNQMVNTYDESGRVVFQRGTAGILNCDYDYLPLPDGSGRLTTITDSLGATTSHGFDRELQLRDIIDPTGRRTHIDYNADRRPLTITDPDGATTRYLYNDAGDRAKIIRPDGNSTEIEYLWRHRPSTITSPDGSISRREWTTDGDLAAVIDPAGNRTEFTYHPNGALATIVESNGARTTMQVDAAGLLTQVTQPDGTVTRIRHDAAGRPTHVIDPLGTATRFDWSPAGKLLRRTDPDDHTESWTYDGEGNTRSYTDRTGGVTQFAYGAFDLLHSRTEPDGSITRYTWDTERRVTAVHNPIGQSWTYEYDSAGRLIAETDYAGATTRYTHDRAGRIGAITPATGTTRHHRHDLLGRLTEITAGDEWIRYTYDPVGRVLSAVNGTGADPTHSLEFAYTATGSTAAERLDTRQPMLFEHDQRGHRIRRTTPSGAVATWHHDVTGRLDQLSADERDITFDYDPLGRLTGWRVDELAITRGITAVGQVTHQDVTAFPARSLSLGSGLSARPAPHLLRRDEFTYRPDGYLIGHTVARAQADRLHRDYSLDAAGRITTVSTNGNPTERYTYDALSNIINSATPATPSSSTPVAAPAFPTDDNRREYRDNLLVRDGRTRFHYDAAGRLIRKTTVRLSRKPDVWHYRYNAFDELVDVWTPDHQWWHYTYDALGRRTTKQHLATDGTVLERVDYLWDGLHLIEQATSTSTIRWQYQPGSHTPLTQTTDVATIDREFYAIVTDLAGAPTELIDPTTAQSVAVAAADLWGRTNWRGKTSSPLRFPGQIYDPETGLHYNMFRYYNPDTGQYLTPDPLGLAPAPNPYAYTTNPLRFIDPLGLTPSACERFDNFNRQVTPGELQRAPAPYPGGRAGHADTKHRVTPQVQASILNNPDRVFSGTFRGENHITGQPYTREVDIYYRASHNDPARGSVVITEAGNKNSVITAYGLIDRRVPNPKPVKVDNWAGNPDYVEIRTNNGANEVVFPNRERWERNDWP
ncbi:putative T7SS-secreted protein [Nocardia sp. NPDC051756]|uniref:putative T7SS-secreted protein n=1 Tax=Nocardia sp. NPDC051756 TaxID=3154751 RepID=UPI00344A6A80